MKNYFYISTSTDGWRNLAQDEWFIDNIKKDELILYLYVNKNAVIIGKNQNPWKECSLPAMEADDVQLVRRISGGGAVYHDTGNLNFSFIGHKDRYDLDKQMSMILSAVRMMGIDAEASGRNDITADGRKFSGNAFASRKENKQHHGTLLLNADLTKLPGYLTVDPKKIQSKGIDSVRARVVNLCELNDTIDVDMGIDALKSAFLQSYGDFEEYVPTAAFAKESDTLYDKHSSWEWRLGQAPKFDFETDTRFAWGGIQLFLSMRDSVVSQARVFSDSMDENIADRIASKLLGVRFSSPELAAALRGDGELMDDVADYLVGLGL